MSFDLSQLQQAEQEILREEKQEYFQFKDQIDELVEEIQSQDLKSVDLNGWSDFKRYEGEHYFMAITRKKIAKMIASVIEENTEGQYQRLEDGSLPTDKRGNYCLNIYHRKAE